MPESSLAERILELVSLYGYYIVFLAQALESAAFLGLLVPGDIILLVVSFSAALGYLNLYLVILVASVGAVVGDNLIYWVSRKGGRPFVDRHHKFFRLSKAGIQRGEEFYARYGAKTILLTRMVPFLRVITIPLAGIYRMSYSTFLVYDLTGHFARTTAYSLLGYYFGRNWDLLMKIIDLMGWTTLVIALLVATGIYGFYRIKFYRAKRSPRDIREAKRGKGQEKIGVPDPKE
ncbi:membrane-associated protein [Candidatus Hakubella thermalkaliphila]|uniref:Membrane-associated protein n=1 Tax=Candidatus Hakubella thermalkaliphila TaxID=2754717 RepID=A0A6V8NQG6_9ACTN|nr:DedA family protein [Candidatus Hakubella thermalkaliphila]MBT9170363.1 putative membrane protein [Actinomycetota bacterium]GFP19458.1 membrane-associated protein [Candidatus Hakubella thermalkaliphila]GFP22562.1 hypothetical protein HKBW3S09_00029 [Candidatus Hakubella thermalkaliphila]GFP30397.1 membrane-associated protein [Candidatus Hakubella thermalkaliphila]GFP33258.1 membrane-associated protein [Candidatus Hakubella thermalkaliphila]